MKSFILLIAFAAFAAFAASAQAFAVEATCRRGEHVLKLRMTSNIPREVHLSNESWGKNGVGNWQSLAIIEGNHYVVSSHSKASVYLIKGAVLKFNYDRSSNLRSVEIVDAGRYSCSR